MSELLQQRAMLQILIAACSTARDAFLAAANEVDAELLTDLTRMIERSEQELERLTARIQELAGVPAG